MVSLATSSMMPQIAGLWRLGFGDEPAYTDFVFKSLLTPEKVLVYREKSGQPVGMLCMEPMELMVKGTAKKGIYMYAFTVHPAMRGKHIGEKMLEEFHKYLKAKGVAASILTPASESLFGYYEKSGYETAFSVQEITRTPEQLFSSGKNCILLGRSLDHMADLRDKYFGNSDLYVRWDTDYLHFVGEESHLRGGGSVLASCNGKTGYLVYRVENDEVMVTECAVPNEILEDVLYTLHKRVGAKKYRIRCAVSTFAENTTSVLPFAMIKWYDKQSVSGLFTNAPYISHVMD